MKTFKDKLLDAVYPPSIYCISCGAIIDSSRTYWLCDSCIKKFLWNTGRRCQLCGKALSEEYVHETCYDCREYGKIYNRGISCCTYGLMEKNLIADFKYNDKSYLSEPIGNMLYDVISMQNISFDIIIPVPLHRSRFKKRGYNQAELLGKTLGERTGKPCNSKVILRTKNTDAMKTMSLMDRRESIRGAFAFSEDMKNEIKGSKILLVDDICTTGATLDGCAYLLFQAGAEEVSALTFASGGNLR